MKKSKLRVRPAMRADIEAFSDLPQKPTLKAWIGEIDGRAVALGGLAFANGRWFGFCDLKQEARLHKMTIARTARRILAQARAQGIRFIYASADPDEPRALRWLTSLGFRLDPRTSLYRWRA